MEGNSHGAEQETNGTQKWATAETGPGKWYRIKYILCFLTWILEIPQGTNGEEREDTTEF